MDIAVEFAKTLELASGIVIALGYPPKLDAKHYAKFEHNLQDDIDKIILWIDGKQTFEVDQLYIHVTSRWAANSGCCVLASKRSSF